MTLRDEWNETIFQNNFVISEKSLNERWLHEIQSIYFELEGVRNLWKTREWRRRAEELKNRIQFTRKCSEALKGKAIKYLKRI